MKGDGTCEVIAAASILAKVIHKFLQLDIAHPRPLLIIVLLGAVLASGSHLITESYLNIMKCRTSLTHEFKDDPAAEH